MNKLSQIQIKDNWLFYFFYPIIPFCIIHIGNDNSFYKLLHIPSYYTDLLLGFFCVYLIGFYYRKVFNSTLFFNFYSQGKKLKIFLITVIIPCSFCLISELLYLVFFLKIKVSESSIFYLELPLILIFSAIITLIYISLYINNQKINLVENFKDEQTKATKSNAEYTSTFMVHQGVNSKVIAISEIAYFKIDNKLTQLITYNNESFYLHKSLNEILNTLDPNLFFQLNRKIISSKKAVKLFEQTDTRKLKITLNPIQKETIFVSKLRAKSFTLWLKST